MAAHASPTDQLRTQHADLLELMADCERLADELDAGRSTPELLLAHVARLRELFDVHHRFEEQVLRTTRTHVVEHRRMHERLAGTVTDELRATLDRLREHLLAEEAQLAPR